MQQGMQQGIQQGMHQMVKKLLAAGVDKNKVAELSELPLAEIESLQELD